MLVWRVQEMRQKQLVVMLNALLRRYVEGDVEGFRVCLTITLLVLQALQQLQPIIMSSKSFPHLIHYESRRMMHSGRFSALLRPSAA